MPPREVSIISQGAEILYPDLAYSVLVDAVVNAAACRCAVPHLMVDLTLRAVNHATLISAFDRAQEIE